MKKLFALLIMLFGCFTLAACGSDDDKTPAETPDNGEEGGSGAATTVTNLNWKASDWTGATTTWMQPATADDYETLTDGLYLYGTTNSSGAASTKVENKTGYNDYTAWIKLGGTCTTTSSSGAVDIKSCFMITTVGAVTVELVCNSGSSNSNRQACIKDATGTTVTSSGAAEVLGDVKDGDIVVTKNVSTVTLNLTESGTYYIGSASSGMAFFEITVTGVVEIL